MSSIISEEEKTFKFTDIFDNQENHYCFVTINIKKLQYESNQQYYDISYRYKFSNNSKQAERAHPFFYHKISENEVNGVIVNCNTLTEKMVEYLLMDEETLSKCIGNSWWIQYKIQVMLAINNFWD